MMLNVQKRNTPRKARRDLNGRKVMQEHILGMMRDPSHVKRSDGGQKLTKAVLDEKTYSTALSTSARALKHRDLMGVPGWARSSVRSNAAYALTNAARAGADVSPLAGALMERLSDRRDEVRKHSQFALAAALQNKKSSDNVLEMVSARLEAGSPEVQKNLLWVLGEASEKKHVFDKVVSSGVMVQVARMLSNEDVASDAFRTCKSLLEAGLRHPDADVRDQVKRAYSANLQNGGSVSDSLPPLVDACTETSWEVVRSVAGDRRKRDETLTTLRDVLKTRTGAGRDPAELMDMVSYLEGKKREEVQKT